MLPTGTVLPLPFGISIPWTGHLEEPYTQLRLLKIFKYEASSLKPVLCVITHTSQVYACTLTQESGLATDI